MKIPTVSVVMAAKNYAAFLPEAIDSLLAQTFPDWELVIVDDGSTDATPAVVRPYLADSRIRYFRSDVLGQSRAKNLGIGFSRGEFIAFLDADDAWFPTKLAEQVELLRASPTVGVTYTQRELIDETGRSLGFRHNTEPRLIVRRVADIVHGTVSVLAWPASAVSLGSGKQLCKRGRFCGGASRRRYI